MKKMLVGLFILGSVAFGCEGNEKAMRVFNQSFEKIVTEIEMDIKIHNEISTPIGVKAKEVDRELGEFIKNLNHLKEHKLNDKQKRDVLEKMSIVDFLVNTYCELAKRNK